MTDHIRPKETWVPPNVFGDVNSLTAAVKFLGSSDGFTLGNGQPIGASF